MTKKFSKPDPLNQRETNQSVKGDKVIILGGGVAGLSAAHELLERGFKVEVHELNPRIPGGKARSIPFVNSGKHGRYDLPGEHGFRFFPRFYKHVTDTMKRIPFNANKNGVFDNLVQADRAKMARYNKEAIEVITRFPRNLKDLKALFYEIFGSDSGLSKEDIEFFSGRLWVLITSCYDRRLAEYEQISWWDFIEAEGRSKAYQNLLAIGLTRTLVAARAREASARTGGDILLQLIFDIVTPGISSDRLLNGPTNDAWIYPWLSYLEDMGIEYYYDSKVISIDVEDNEISGVTVAQQNPDKKNEMKTIQVQGDYYISCLPVEVIEPLISDEMLKADPGLAGIKELAPNVSWMNGIQFYLKKDVTITHGHVIYIDSEWALTSVSQRQFWYDYDLSNFGDGHVNGILSVDISDWFNKGDLIKKEANVCSKEEIKEEVWHQLKKSLNINGQVILEDDNLHSWFLDPDIIIPNAKHMNQNFNMEPLLINKKDTWKLRPDAVTKIPNFFLASDYVKTYTDLATMEGANEAARRAVNGIIDRSGSVAEKCKLWMLHEPDIFWPWRNQDQKRFDKNLPWSGKIFG